jgi:hypothetical protein
LWARIWMGLGERQSGAGWIRNLLSRRLLFCFCRAGWRTSCSPGQ